MLHVEETTVISNSSVQESATHTRVVAESHRDTVNTSSQNAGNQPDFMHGQLALLKEQVNSVADDVITLRNDFHSIHMTEKRLHQDFDAEVHLRKELETKLGSMIKEVDLRRAADLRSLEDKILQISQSVRETLVEEVDRKVLTVREEYSFHQQSTTRERSQMTEEFERLRQLVDTELRDKAGLLESSRLLGEDLRRQVASLAATLEKEIANHNDSEEELRRLSERELNERRRLEDAVTRQHQDLELCFKQSRSEHESSLEGVRSQCSALRQELIKDMQERVDEEAALRRAIHAEESNIAQLKRSLEVESEERRSALEQLQRRIADLAGLPDFLQQLQTSLQSECSERAKEVIQLRSRMDTIALAADEVASQRAAASQAVIVKAELATELVEKESRERRSSIEDLDSRLRELAEALSQERGDRESGCSQLRAQLSTCRQELVAEKDERADGMAAIRRSLQSHEGQTSCELKDLKVLLETEMQGRDASYEKLQGNYSEIRSGLAEEVTSRTDFYAELRTALSRLRSTVEEEATMRRSAEDDFKTALQSEVEKMAASFNDESQQLRSDLQILRQELSIELSARVAGHDAQGEAREASIQQLSEGITEALRVEREQRLAGDEASGHVKQDIGYVKEEVRRLDKIMCDVKAALEVERSERVAGDATDRDAIKRCCQEMFDVTELRTMQEKYENLSRDLTTSLREELGLQEAVLLAAEASIGTLKEALAHEADARSRADQELRQDASLQISSLRRLLTEVDATVTEMRQETSSETQNLWEAIDTHTHDVDVEDMRQRSAAVQSQATEIISSTAKPVAPQRIIAPGPVAVMRSPPAVTQLSDSIQAPAITTCRPQAVPVPVQQMVVTPIEQRVVAPPVSSYVRAVERTGCSMEFPASSVAAPVRRPSPVPHGWTPPMSRNQIGLARQVSTPAVTSPRPEIVPEIVAEIVLTPTSSVRAVQETDVSTKLKCGRARYPYQEDVGTIPHQKISIEDHQTIIIEEPSM